MLRRLPTAVGLVLVCVVAACVAPSPPVSPTAQQEGHQDIHEDVLRDTQDVAGLPPVRPQSARLDHSGRQQKGRASYYARRFTNRKMADGGHFDPNSNAAASKTLPLGTTAKVTNLANGKSATVTVQDRGPYLIPVGGDGDS